MPWTVPKTWSASEVVGAADLNTHIRDNLNELKDPPFYHSAITANWSANGDWTGVSTLSAVLSTNGGDVMVGFHCHIYNARCVLNVLVDGGLYTSALHGLYQVRHANTASPTGMTVDFQVWVTGLTSGVHTFQPVISSPGWSLVAGEHMPTIFWAREIS